MSTDLTLGQRAARPAEGKVVKPTRVLAGVVAAALGAHGAPLALPVALGHLLQRRVDAVNVVRDVALVAEDELVLVVRLAAAFAEGAVQAAPPLLQDHFRYLRKEKGKKTFEYFVRIYVCNFLHTAFFSSILDAFRWSHSKTQRSPQNPAVYN